VNAVNDGIRSARRLLVHIISELGLPVATRFVDAFTPLYVGDLVSWASPCHAQLASGVPMPVGFDVGYITLVYSLRSVPNV
jgi:3-deoxy-7-phosphoheptulonate synthase